MTALPTKPLLLPICPAYKEWGGGPSEQSDRPLFEVPGMRWEGVTSLFAALSRRWVLSTPSLGGRPDGDLRENAAGRAFLSPSAYERLPHFSFSFVLENLTTPSMAFSLVQVS